jgi:hypothetical protein
MIPFTHTFPVFSRLIIPIGMKIIRCRLSNRKRPAGKGFLEVKLEFGQMNGDLGVFRTSVRIMYISEVIYPPRKLAQVKLLNFENP